MATTRARRAVYLVHSQECLPGRHGVELHAERHRNTCRHLRSVELLLDFILEFPVVVGKVLVCFSSVVGDFDGHEEAVPLVIFHNHFGLEASPVSRMALFVRYPNLYRTKFNPRVVRSQPNTTLLCGF